MAASIDPLAPGLLGPRQGAWHRTVRHGRSPYSPGVSLVPVTIRSADDSRQPPGGRPSAPWPPDALGRPWSRCLADDPELIATTDGRVPGRRGRATRQRLLECTAELLVATPWRSIKVIDIARQAGTSPATFYQYFENVEAAITVLAEELVEGVGRPGRAGRRRLVGGGQLGRPRSRWSRGSWSTGSATGPSSGWSSSPPSRATCGSRGCGSGPSTRSP